MKRLTLLLTLMTLSSCSTGLEKSNDSRPNSKEISGTINQKAAGCLCIKMWMPVCGSDGKTYGNSCEAKCSGVEFTMGSCQNLNSNPRR